MRTYAHRPAALESRSTCALSEPAPDISVPRDLAIKMKKKMNQYSLFDLRKEIVTTFKYVHDTNSREAETLLIALQSIVRRVK